MAVKSMAASCNFLSFLPASKPTPPIQLTPPPSSLSPISLSFSSSPSSTTTTLSLSIRNRDGLPPVLPKESHCSSDLLSVVCPSLAFANALFFKSAYNVQVIVGENEPEEKLINRFRREVLKAGIIQESKRRRFFESKQDERKRKTREAAKRNRKRRPKAKAPQQNKEAGSEKKKDDDEDDNWEFIDVDLPYC
ncbi:hypothetical protein F0562_023324 [Nyssa sinensis]|uniref:30S ribosomal protein S21, chloroplastic n=1 Tax=Nyssa sinensis TaxID=561372 RepID=A0A5J5BKD6_9ASTE|nr:hypothetical protein F0562_023324 [Nyssa sinensis]